MKQFSRAPAFVLALGLCLLPLVLRAQAPQPAAVLVEAEAFRPASGSAWRTIRVGENYYWATLANTFISRQKLLSAPEQCDRSEASAAVEIPADGSYRVWTRYELPSRWRAEHGLRIAQDGKVVLDRIYGKIESPKLWPFGKGIVPMVDWSWGSGDNIVWEQSDPVTLRRGTATLTLVAAAQAGEALPGCRGAARRNVDCVLLTSDLEEGIRDAKEAFYHRLDRHLSQAGDLWIRVTNPKEARAPVWVDLKVDEHNPYWQERAPAPRIGARGAFSGDPADPDWLAPGRASPWVALGQALDSTNWQELTLSATPRPEAGQAPVPGISLGVEFARDSEGRRPISSTTVRHPEVNRAVFEIPADVREAREIRTLEAMQRDLLSFLQKREQRGRVPERVPVLGIVGGPWQGRALKTPDELYRLRAETGLLLGRNTWKRGELPEDLARQYAVQPRKNLVLDVRGVPTEKLEQHLLDLKAKGETDQVLIVSFGDEITVGGFDPAAPADQQAFRDYLSRLRGMDAAARGREYACYVDVPDPAEVKLTRDPADGRSFYWSYLWSSDRGIDAMKARTAIVEKVLGPGVYTGANYSPHPEYWPRTGQWWRMFRRRGMTMPWAEDWIHQVPEVSPQAVSYLTDVLRCGAKYEDLPIQFYTMPHYPGQTARSLTLSFYSALAHGNRVLNFFAAVPVYEYTENYVAWEGRENWAAVADLVHDVGIADDLLWNGRVRPARVALLLSGATDAWEEARDSSVYNLERKNLYYALRHAGLAVDFVTEEDVIEGWLDGAPPPTPNAQRPTPKPEARSPNAQRPTPPYQALYVCGDHMLRGCAERIREWVKRGGCLYSVAGGGLRDEYDRPLDTLKEVYGISGQTLKLTEKHVLAKEGLAWLPPLTTCAFTEVPPPGRENRVARFPALIARQDLSPTLGAEVVMAFGAREPAMVQHPYGAGTAILIGTFPGTAYVQAAVPKRPYDRGASDANFNHFLPVDFPAGMLDAIVPPAVRSAVAKGGAGAVSLSTGMEGARAPLVDATVIEAPQGLVVPLVNYGGAPIPGLRVTVPGAGAVRSVESARQGRLRFTAEGDSLTVTLPLDWADMIVVRR